MTKYVDGGVIDGDGHVIEDQVAIAERFPEGFRGDEATLRSPLFTVFPPGDHFHAAQPLRVPPGSFLKPGPAEWVEFAVEVGLVKSVLYPSWGLHYGHVVSRDWAIALCRAYNDWLFDTYVMTNPLFEGVALIPMQEPEAAVEELRRVVRDLGFVGAILPSTGLPLPLGDKRYWPVYEEADRLGCAMAVHGGAHGGLGMDHFNVYAGVNALGHPIGVSISFASMILNGVFDKYSNARFGFLEAGVGWMLMTLERLERGYDTHLPHDPRGELVQLRDGESLVSYVRRQVTEGRLFIGCEGDESMLPLLIEQLGHGVAFFSSDFPHEVNSDRCKHEIEELLANDSLSDTAKHAVLRGNAERFYGLGS